MSFPNFLKKSYDSATRRNTFKAMGIERISERDLRRVFNDITEVLRRDISPFLREHTERGANATLERLGDAKKYMKDIRAKVYDALRNTEIVVRLAEILERIVPQEKEEELKVVEEGKRIEHVFENIGDPLVKDALNSIGRVETWRSLERSPGQKFSPASAAQLIHSKILEIERELKYALGVVNDMFGLEEDMRRDLKQSLKKA